MKRNIILDTLVLALFITCAFSTTSQAQVMEGKRLMSLGQYNALSVDLPHTKKGEVEKAWTKYMKEFGHKTKRNVSQEVFVDNATIAAMSRNTVDIFATINEKGEDTELVVWFDLGGAFLSSEMHTDRYPVAEKMLWDFCMRVSKTAVEEELNTQEVQLQKLSDKLLRLRQEKQSLEKDIMEYAEKIAEARRQIEGVTKEYNTAKEERMAQETAVENVKSKLKAFNAVAKK